MENDLLKRLKFHGRYATETEMECAERKNAERDEAATALAEQAARIAELDAELIKSRNFWSDELSAKNAQLTASRAECEGLRAALEKLEKARPTLNSSHDYSRGWNDALFCVARIARAALSQKETDA